MKNQDSHPAIEDRFLDHPYALAGRVIDPVPGTLNWQGKTTHLRRKELEVLALLASVDGQVVSRQDFITVVWNGNALVADHAITNTMSSLRQALQDDDIDRPLIRTIPRRGYQLGVAVQASQREPAAFLPGSIVVGSPGWRLTQRLGESSTSETWLAEPTAYDVEHESRHRVFRFCRSEAHLRRLQREITLLRYVSQRLSESSNIAFIRDWRLDEPPYYLARDYASYGNLTDWATANGGLPQTPQTQLKCMTQLADAMAALHELGVAHRQFGADCILVDQSETGPQLKISAFGLGALVDRSKLEALKITAVGLTLGVDEVAAIPHADDTPNNNSDSASDVHALGVVLLQLAAEDLRATNTPEWLQKIQNPTLRALIAACFGPADTRPSAAVLAAQLRSLDETPASTASTNTPATSSLELASALIPEAVPVTDTPKLSEAPKMIGHYHLLDRLGEGGMGTVYLAEQREPVYRKVALKIIRSGMDGKQILSRFDAERQALAMMNHPNVATVLDSGLDNNGRPFFAMEYIAGVDIAHYCDTHHLSLENRVKVFLQACDGVLHAHQKGVLHRDIKPSNLMVSSAVDSAGTVKVIDFGLAKSLHGKLALHTLHTSFGAFIGTPIYSSPEYVSGSVSGVDTRSDIYSMGVVLYELLAGVTPISSESLENLEPEKVREMVCKTHLPTMRQQLLSVPADKRSEIAESRSINVNDLPQTLEGDLSSVVGKCLERDPNDRYASVLELKKDLQRWLELRPVEARPTSKWYRFRKLVQRNRGTSILVAGSVAVLLISTTAAITGYVRAERALKQAQIATEEATQASEFQVNQIQSLDTKAMGDGLRKSLAQAVQSRVAQHDPAAVELSKQQFENLVGGVNFTDLVTNQLDEYYFQPSLKLIDKDYGNNPLLQAALLQSSADSLHILGLYERAMYPQERALALRTQQLGKQDKLTLLSSARKAVSLQSLGRNSESKPLFEEAIKGLRRTSVPGDVTMLHMIAALAFDNHVLGNDEQAVANYREVVKQSERLHGKLDPDHLQWESSLGILLVRLNKLAEAEPLLEHGYSNLNRILGPLHIDVIRALDGLSNLRAKQGRFDDAMALSAQVLKASEKTNGHNHPYTLANSTHQATYLMEAERYQQALIELNDIAPRVDAVMGNTHLGSFLVKGHTGTVLFKLGRLEEARLYLQSALDGMVKVSGPHSEYSLNRQFQMGALLQAQGQLDEAALLYQDVIKAITQAPNPSAPLLSLARDQLGQVLLAQGKTEAAKKMLKVAQADSRKVEGFRQAAITLSIQSHYAQILPTTGPEPNAISLLTYTIAQMRNVKGVELAVQIEAPTALAKLLNDQGKAQDALNYAKQAVDIGKKAFPDGHYLVAAAQTQQARALMALGRNAEAKAALLEAKKQISNTEGLDPLYESDLKKVFNTLK